MALTGSLLVSCEIILWIRVCSERDLFLTRTILQYLCVEDLASANAVFDGFRSTFLDASPSGDRIPMEDESSFLDSPLINFVDFCKPSVGL